MIFGFEFFWAIAEITGSKNMTAKKYFILSVIFEFEMKIEPRRHSDTKLHGIISVFLCDTVSLWFKKNNHFILYISDPANKKHPNP